MGIQSRGIDAKPHHIRDDDHQCSSHPAFRWEPDLEGEFPGEVVHATGRHECEAVADGGGFKYALACRWADPTVG